MPEGTKRGPAGVEGSGVAGMDGIWHQQQSTSGARSPMNHHDQPRDHQEHGAAPKVVFANLGGCKKARARFSTTTSPKTFTAFFAIILDLDNCEVWPFRMISCGLFECAELCRIHCLVQCGVHRRLNFAVLGYQRLCPLYDPRIPMWIFMWVCFLVFASGARI